MSKRGIAGKIADAAGVPSGLTQWITDPAGSLGRAAGIPPEVMEVGKFIANPAGYVVNQATGTIKDKAMEALRNAPSVPGGGEEGGRGEGSSVDQGFNLRRRGFDQDEGFKRGGKVKSKSKASSASKRADGIAQRGKTKGRYI